MNEGNNPAPEAPETIEPVNGDGGTPPAAPAGDEPSGEQPSSHIQPGQNVTEIDFEQALDDLANELEEEGAQPKDPENPEEPENSENPEAPKDPEAPEQPKEEPAKPTDDDPFAQVDYKDVSSLISLPEDPEYNIKPLGEIRNPNPGETAQDYFTTVTAPAVAQLVQNMTGAATRNVDRMHAQAQQAEVERMQSWGVQIQDLEKRGYLKGVGRNGNVIDPQSEGGQQIGKVLEYIKEHNSKPENQNDQITSFKHGFLQWSRDQQEQQKTDTRQQNNQRRRNNAALLGGGGNGNGAPKNAAPRIRKGQAVTDLDFESLLS